MKKVLLLLIAFFLFSMTSGQGINNLWLLGYDGGGGGINFDFSVSPLNITQVNRKMNFLSANASICDSNGNILFYTNGLWIANANHDTMVNGSGLNPGQIAHDFINYGHPIPQMSIIIPKPGDNDEYYIFHEAMEIGSPLFSPVFYHTLIDMSLDSGLGAVIFKNNILFYDSLLGGEITATRHGNGRDWWVLTHCINSDKYISVLVTPFGIFGPYLQNIGNIRIGGTQACFSPQGNKYADYNTTDDLEVFDFDRCNGLLSNHIYVPINDSMGGGGVSFSPNGRFVYCSSGKFVYQFDLWSSNVAASQQTVAVWDSTYSPSYPFATQFLLMQLAPDNKIYINTPSSTKTFHVINSPDSLGPACDLQKHSISLPTYNARTIPNHPNYFLGRELGSPCDSLTPVAEIKNNTIPIRINPNPAQNTFYLNYNLPYGMNALATIYNTLGETVMKKNLYWYFGYLQIDCSGLENGVYVVKVTGAGIAGSARVVIIH